MIRCLNEDDFSKHRVCELIAQDTVQVDLKIGIHKGAFLCRMASKLRDRFFVGVECKEEESKLAADRVNRQRLDNVMVVNMEAHRFVRDCVADATFQGVHVYFPTPYPWAIGLNSRLITSTFATELARILKPGGELRIVTDHEEYYKEMCHLFDAQSWWALDWQRLDVGQIEKFFVGSPCEVDYRSEGAEIFALQFWRN